MDGNDRRCGRGGGGHGGYFSAVRHFGTDSAIEQQLFQGEQLGGVLQIRQATLLALQLVLDRFVLRMLRIQHQLGVVAHLAQVLQSLGQ